MPDLLQVPQVMKAEGNGIRVEFHANGITMIFVDPEYSVQSRLGRSDGQSGRLYTQIVISPLLPTETSQMPAPSRPTKLTK